jgi:hypothetical protein
MHRASLTDRFNPRPSSLTDETLRAQVVLVGLETGHKSRTF